MIIIIVLRFYSKELCERTICNMMFGIWPKWEWWCQLDGVYSRFGYGLNLQTYILISEIIKITKLINYWRDQ